MTNSEKNLGIEGSELKFKIVKKDESGRSNVESVEKQLSDLVADLDWTEKLLESYETEQDSQLKEMKFQAMEEAFTGLKLEERFSSLNSGDDEKISEQYLRLVKIKNTIEQDWNIYEKKAA